MSEIDGKTALLSLALLLVGVSFLVGPLSGGALWGWWGTWIYCSAIAWIVAAGVVAARTTSLLGAEIALPTLLCGWALLQRPWIAEKAYEYTVCRRPVGDRTVRGRRGRVSRT